MKKVIIILSLVCFFGIACNFAFAQSPVYYKEVNTPKDEYGAAFRTKPDGIELWVTTNAQAANKRSKKLKRYVYQSQLSLSSDKYTLKEQEYLKSPVMSELPDSNSVYLDGVPTFPYCNGWGIFTSNRYTNGRDLQNDLYEMSFDSLGMATVNRLDNLNSDYWDDSPSLSDGGRFMYFSSDRKNPGQGKTDIFLSIFENGGWSAPIPLDEVNTDDFSEQTPFIANDGHLYFSTNQTTDSTYDIWFVKIDLSSGKPIGKPQPVTLTGVNLPGSDESHPIFSPGGSWFVFSSNREENGTKDLDLYYVKAPVVKDPIDFNVLVQTRAFNPDTRTYEDAVNPLSTKVKMTDVRSGKMMEFISDKEGNAQIEVERFGGEVPTDDGRIKKLIVTAQSPDPKYVAPIDTLFFDIYCNDKINHVLTLIDTAIYNNPECRQDFPVEKVQFFVSAYWCPTTLKFKSKTPCASVFSTDDCLEVTWEEPEKPCDHNDLWRYDLEFSKPKVVRTRQGGLCADMGEAQKNGNKYAVKVDSAIVKFIEIMKSAMQNQCVLKALSKGKKINVEVIGWTDPGGIDMRCQYTGRTINFNDTNTIQLKNIEKKDYLNQRNRILENGTAFRVSKEKGNEMLADLRAYYTAMLLDEVWKDSVDTYRRARENGNINLIAWGAGIDKSNASSKAAQRSVNVIVEVPIAGGEKLESFKPDPGRLVDLSIKCGQNPCKPKPSTTIARIDNGGSQVTPTPPPPIDKDKSIISTSNGVEGNCWSILIQSFEDKAEAEQLVNNLLIQDIPSRIEEYKDSKSKMYYRVKVGCWQQQDVASGTLQKIMPIIKDMNLKKKPYLHK